MSTGWERKVAFDRLRGGVTIALARGILWGGRTPDISDCLAARLPDAPHILAIWEPLATKAPSPSRCQPYCCYRKTVIFYHRPYIARGCGHPWRANGRWHWEPNKTGFAVFDQIESRLCHGDIVAFDGDEFEIGGGRVLWHGRRWWMARWALRCAA